MRRVLVARLPQRRDEFTCGRYRALSRGDGPRHQLSSAWKVRRSVAAMCPCEMDVGSPGSSLACGKLATQPLLGCVLCVTEAGGGEGSLRLTGLRDRDRTPIAAIIREGRSVKHSAWSVLRPQRPQRGPVSGSVHTGEQDANQRKRVFIYYFYTLKALQLYI